MPTTVTVDDVRERIGILARMAGSAFLVDQTLSSVAGIKVYGSEVALIFRDMHASCHLGDQGTVPAKDLPQHPDDIVDAVDQLGYLFVRGESPAGHDYEHRAPELLLISNITRTQDSWKEGLERRSRSIIEELPRYL